MTSTNRILLLVLLAGAISAVQAQSPGSASADRSAEKLNPFSGKYFSVEALEQERQSKALLAQIAQSNASIAQAKVQEMEAMEKMKRGVTLAPVATAAVSPSTANVRSADVNVPTKPARVTPVPRKAVVQAPVPPIAPVPNVVPSPVLGAAAMPSFEVARIRFADGREVRFQERGTEVAMIDRNGAPVRVDRAATIAVDTRPPQPANPTVPGAGDVSKLPTPESASSVAPPRTTPVPDRPTSLGDALITTPTSR